MGSDLGLTVLGCGACLGLLLSAGRVMHICRERAALFLSMSVL